MILDGCPNGGSTASFGLLFTNISTRAVYDYGSGVTIANDDSGKVRVQIVVSPSFTANNLLFKPMIRLASDTDPTYEPYHESVEEEIEQIYADNGVLGAKNLLPISLTTRTENGVTVTVNKDSNGNVLSVVLNGTSTSSGQYNLNNTSGLLNSLLQKYGDLIWSGCPSRTDCRMYTHISGGSYVTLTNNEEKILSASNNYDASILVQYDNGVTYNNVTFYPMLRLASDPDDTYQPHAMTNRELTENKLDNVFRSNTYGVYNGDLNDLTDGIRYCNGASANVPVTNAWGFCQTYYGGSANRIQLYFTNAGKIYSRVFDSSTWRAWKEITMA
jgi:hypothetical protein